MAAKDSKRKTVTLVDPNGIEHEASVPTEVNTLVFGQGYKLKDKKLSVDEAIASLAADSEPTTAPAVTQTA